MPESTAPRPPTWLRLADLWVVVAGLAIVTVYWAPTFFAHATGFPLDDSWIYAVVARNLAEGSGYSYNPGIPVSACTGFAWPFVLAVFYRAFPGHPVAVGQACGVAFYLLSALACRRLFRLVEGEAVALFGAFIFLAYPFVVWGSLSGMETMATTFLVTAGLYLRLSDPARTNRALLGAVLLSVAGLFRPEAFALLPIVELSAWLADRRLARPRDAWVRVFIWAEIVAIYALLNLTLFGSAIPNTYVAKIRFYGSFGARMTFSSRLLHDLWVLLATCADFIYGFAIKFILPLSPFVVLGIATKNRTARTLAFTLVLYFGAVTVVTGGILQWKLVVTAFQGGRYYQHVIPMMIFLGLAGLRAATGGAEPAGESALVKRSKPIVMVMLGVTFAAYLAMISAAGETYATKMPKATAAAIAIVVVVLVIPPLFAWAGRNRLDRALAGVIIGLSIAYVLGASLLYSRLYATNVGNINDMHVVMGRWVAANVPENALVALNDVGGIVYFSRRTIIDITGTVSPEVLPTLLKSGDVISESDSGVVQVLTEARPEYVIVFPQWFPTLTSRLSTSGSPAGSCEAHRVTIVGNTVAGGDTMVVYKPDWRWLAQWLPSGS